jgi:hypothetical protein
VDNRRLLKCVESRAGLTFDDFSTLHKMAKGNKLKNQANNGKAAKPKATQNPTGGKAFSGIKSGISATTSFLAEERIKKISGFILSISSVFLLVAISSYLFTAKHDQALIDMDTDTLSASGERFRNTMGRTGAIIGRFFVEKWFGVRNYFGSENLDRQSIATDKKVGCMGFSPVSVELCELSINLHKR